MVDAESGRRTQVVHESYPQVVDSVDACGALGMMDTTAPDVSSAPWKPRLFWGTACGRDLWIA